MRMLENVAEVTELAPGRLGCQALQRAGNTKWLSDHRAAASLACSPDCCVDGGTLSEKL